MMGTDYTDAMVEVIRRAFDMMFGIEVTRSACSQDDGSIPPIEVSGVIGITGAKTGSVVMSFTDEFARKMAAETFDDLSADEITDEDVHDCVGELANVVGGNLMPILGDGKTEQRVSLPNVVVGTHRVVWRRKDTPYDIVMFDSAFGYFGVGLNLSDDGGM